MVDECLGDKINGKLVTMTPSVFFYQIKKKFYLK